MKIKILGTGCPKCQALTANAEAAAEELGMAYALEKITDINQIIGFGVMMTPALVIDDEVKSVGKVLTTAQIKDLMS